MALKWGQLGVCLCVLLLWKTGASQEPAVEDFSGSLDMDSTAVVVGPELRAPIAAMEAGDYFAAAAELRDLVYRDSTHVHALRLLASAFSHLGDYVQAIDACERLAQLDSLDAGVEITVGFFHQKLGDFESAEQHYRQALMRDKKVIQAYQGLGWIYLEQGRLEQALDMVTETTERAPNYAPNYLLMGRVLTAQGFYEDASVAYRRAFALQSALREQYGILLQELRLRHNLGR